MPDTFILQKLADAARKVLSGQYGVEAGQALKSAIAAPSEPEQTPPVNPEGSRYVVGNRELPELQHPSHLSDMQVYWEDATPRVPVHQEWDPFMLQEQAKKNYAENPSNYTAIGEEEVQEYDRLKGSAPAPQPVDPETVRKAMEAFKKMNRNHRATSAK